MVYCSAAASCRTPLATARPWHDLAEGAFKHAGTKVNTALLVINA
jgi:hypothetical protein